MSRTPSLSDWASSRGEKWRATVSGMEAMLAPVDEPLIQALRLDSPCRVADIGCGGGGTAFALLRQAPEGSVVDGFDLSPALVECARERAASVERPISFEIADLSTALPPSAGYDRLVSRFGVMFFHDPPAAFSNLLHWLAPESRFAFAVWGPPAQNLWVATVREVVARFVEIPPSEPEAPGLFRYADVNKLLALLEGAGFTGLSASQWRGRLPVGGLVSPAEAAVFALASFGSFAELLAEAGGEAFDEARRSLADCFASQQQEGAVRLDACVHICTGVRAS
ncbi:MAG: class I SAM-dependent methyltransferase [Acidobacteria bacterium]|nr:class I SAM-dependent methyltransferase [Acidobacteriota bacterium]